MSDDFPPVLGKTLNCQVGLAKELLAGMVAATNPLILQRMKGKTHARHASLAARLKLFLEQRYPAVLTAKIAVEFLHSQEQIRNWAPNSRDTNWGNFIGMMKRGTRYGLPVVDLLADVDFADARTVVDRQAKAYVAEHAKVFPVLDIVHMAFGLPGNCFRLAVALAMILDARMADILELQWNHLSFPDLASGALAVTFFKGKIVGTTGPYTVGTVMGPMEPIIRNAVAAKFLFPRMDEKKKENFETKLRHAMGKLIPGMTLHSVRHSMAVALGQAGATKEQLHHFLRHKAEKNMAKYLGHGKYLYSQLRIGTEAMAVVWDRCLSA